MENLTVSIPHRLSREEARRRIQEQMGTLRNQQGAMVTAVEEVWTGDRMAFTVSAMGQRITGHATVEDQAVQVEVALPWLLKVLAGTVKQRIEEKGRLLLDGPARK